MKGTVLNWGNPLHKPYLLFFLGFVLITIYIPGIIGASVSTGWLFLLIVVPILMLYCEFKLGFGFIFICYAALSILWSVSLNIALFPLLQIVILGCIFLIGQNIKNLTAIFKGLALGLGVSCIVSFTQYFGYHYIYTLGGVPAALFINPNIYSEVSAIMLVSLIVLRLWWWIPVTIPGLFLVHSRAAYVALAVGMFMWGWRLNKYLAGACFIIVGLIGFFIYDGHFNLNSILERFSIWLDTIQGFKLFGNGVGSYETMFPYYATHVNTEFARPKFAHNDILNLIFEFGIGSIFLLMVLFNVFKSNRKELIILCSIFTISLFTYSFHVPTEAFIAFLVAGYITANSNTNRDIRTSRRPILFSRNTTTKFT